MPSVIVNESTFTMAQQIEWLPTVRIGSFFATASGGIGHRRPGSRLGCRAVDVETTGELEQEFKTALGAEGPTVIVVSTQPQRAML